MMYLKNIILFCLVVFPLMGAESALVVREGTEDLEQSILGVKSALLLSGDLKGFEKETLEHYRPLYKSLEVFANEHVANCKKYIREKGIPAMWFYDQKGMDYVEEKIKESTVSAYESPAVTVEARESISHFLRMLAWSGAADIVSLFNGHQKSGSPQGHWAVIVRAYFKGATESFADLFLAQKNFDEWASHKRYRGLMADFYNMHHSFKKHHMELGFRYGKEFAMGEWFVLIRSGMVPCTIPYPEDRCHHYAQHGGQYRGVSGGVKHDMTHAFYWARELLKASQLSYGVGPDKQRDFLCDSVDLLWSEVQNVERKHKTSYVIGIFYKVHEPYFIRTLLSGDAVALMHKTFFTFMSFDQEFLALSEKIYGVRSQEVFAQLAQEAMKSVVIPPVVVQAHDNARFLEEWPELKKTPLGDEVLTVKHLKHFMFLCAAKETSGWCERRKMRKYCKDILYNKLDKKTPLSVYITDYPYGFFMIDWKRVARLFIPTRSVMESDEVCGVFRRFIDSALTKDKFSFVCKEEQKKSV